MKKKLLFVFWTALIGVLFSCGYSYPYLRTDEIKLAYGPDVQRIHKDLDNGSFLFERYDYSGAEKYFQWALNRSRTIGYVPGMISSWNNLAVLFLEKQDPARSVSFLTQAVQKAVEAGYSQDEAECHNNLCAAYLEQSESGSLIFAERELRSARKLNRSSYLEWVIRNNTGLFLARAGDPKRAMKIYRSVIKKAEKKNYYQILVTALIRYSELVQQNEAVIYLQKALDVSTAWSYQRGIIESAGLLARIFEDQEDWKRSELYYLIVLGTKKALGVKLDLESEQADLNRVRLHIP